MHINTAVAEKPNEKNPCPVIPAHCNFEMARKMHVENLEHQPLPDCLADRAYQKMQAEGINHPELALDVLPSATGVGVKTYKAGPTHCTKMRVYRPKTCGVVPKPFDKSIARPCTSVPGGKAKFGAMDLALGWEYRPLDPRDEPQPPNHIDGTNNSVAPAVFVLVKTPRDQTPGPLETGRSGGIFVNTMGEEDFFNRDVAKRNAEFASNHDLGRMCTCGTSPLKTWKDGEKSMHHRTRSASRRVYDTDGNCHNKRCKSSPNVSVLANPSEGSSSGSNGSHHCRHHRHHSKKDHYKENANVVRKQKKYEPERNARVPRLCEINPSKQHLAPVMHDKSHQQKQAAFKAGIPNSNSSGTCTSLDSGCSTLSTSCSSKTVRIPKIKPPYSKKNYVIDTLAPPFACWKGGAGQGGYPEHWRLASVYQHAYKPVEQRKRPLLATVYQ